MAVFAVAGILN